MSPRAESVRGHVIGALVGVLATGGVAWLIRDVDTQANAAALDKRVTAIETADKARDDRLSKIETYVVAIVCHDVPAKCPLDHAP